MDDVLSRWLAMVQAACTIYYYTLSSGSVTFVLLVMEALRRPTAAPGSADAGVPKELTWKRLAER